MRQKGCRLEKDIETEGAYSNHNHEIIVRAARPTVRLNLLAFAFAIVSIVFDCLAGVSAFLKNRDEAVRQSDLSRTWRSAIRRPRPACFLISDQTSLPSSPPDDEGWHGRSSALKNHGGAGSDSTTSPSSACEIGFPLPEVSRHTDHRLGLPALYQKHHSSGGSCQNLPLNGTRSFFMMYSFIDLTRSLDRPDVVSSGYPDPSFHGTCASLSKRELCIVNNLQDPFLSRRIHKRRLKAHGLCPEMRWLGERLPRAALP